jgi:hypothetical protein
LARERWVRKRTDELAAEEDRLKAEESALDRRAQEVTLKTVEVLQEEQHTGALRIAAWADEASTVLVPLGISQNPDGRTPESLSDALPVLDLAAERLWRLDSAFGSRQRRGPPEEYLFFIFQCMKNIYGMKSKFA